MSAAIPKMEIRGVSKTFHARGGTVAALEPCDLAVASGEFVTVVGPSGCGKSTLMMIAAGLEAPSGGDVLVDGRPAGPAGPQRTVVFQRFALFPSETVAENIGFGLRVAKLPRPEIDRRVAEQLELMGLARFRDAYPHELSGGMQQRVAIARALVVRPEILLMDEPFGALDAQTRRILQDELRRIWRRGSQTVLFVTHDVEEAVALGTRIVVMAARPGRIKEVLTRGFDVDDGDEFESNPAFVALKLHVWRSVKEEVDAARA